MAVVVAIICRPYGVSAFDVLLMYSVYCERFLLVFCLFFFFLLLDAEIKALSFCFDFFFFLAEGGAKTRN